MASPAFALDVAEPPSGLRRVHPRLRAEPVVGVDLVGALRAACGDGAGPDTVRTIWPIPRARRR